MTEEVKRVVGLRCDPEAGAPTVVLRGAGATADAVLASGASQKHRLPVVRNERLLEQLYRMPLDAPIDPSLYELIAILLVHVFAVDEAASLAPKIRRGTEAMTTAIELSEIGMINGMRMLDAISHNLANANTPGYKRDIAVTLGFQDALDGQIAARLSGISAGDRELMPAMQLLVDYGPGALQQTGNQLDLAIEGNAFFEVMTELGARYSRAGGFRIDGTGRLVDSHGFAISGVEGDILLNGGDVTIDRDGSVFEDGEYAGRLKLVAFEDPTLLFKEGRGLMRAGELAQVQPIDDSAVLQGYREASNVQVMQEMVQLMTTLRHFETTSRVLKGYDDMIDTAISTIAEF